MDIATLNWLGITLLAAFGLWAFWKGGQAVRKNQQREKGSTPPDTAERKRI